MSDSFVLTGGGTGGHIFPALAVARVLKQSGHNVLFVGTSDGMESRIVPENGFEIEFIHSGGFNRVGLRVQLQTAIQLPLGLLGGIQLLRRFRPAAVFSMGGYVAGPVMIAALLCRIPLVVMEPNAIPGIANRKIAGRVYRALLGFESARKWFPHGKTEVTGLPVRPEFFQIEAPQNYVFTLLITGGSRGARTLNRASRESWSLFRKSGVPVRIIHQCGPAEHAELSREFADAGIEGEIVSFIRDMAAAYARADLILARAGAGAVNEIAAGGMPSVLVPFPFAADDHQKRNAEELVKAGAARMVLDAEMNGERLFHEVEGLRNDREELARMRASVRQFAKPGAAERAAEVLEEAAAGRKA